MPRKEMILDINRIKSFVAGQIRFKDLINNISDPNKVTFCIQSMISALPELTEYYMNLVTLSAFNS